MSPENYIIYNYLQTIINGTLKERTHKFYNKPNNFTILTSEKTKYLSIPYVWNNKKKNFLPYNIQ